VIGDEPRLAYNRELLSSVLAGEIAPEVALCQGSADHAIRSCCASSAPTWIALTKKIA